jgi:hypothetical protein
MTLTIAIKNTTFAIKSLSVATLSSQHTKAKTLLSVIMLVAVMLIVVAP